jgi:hypothetical protein
VQYTKCPTILCPVCSKEILPNTPIRRDDAALPLARAVAADACASAANRAPGAGVR